MGEKGCAHAGEARLRAHETLQSNRNESNRIEYDQIQELNIIEYKSVRRTSSREAQIKCNTLHYTPSEYNTREAPAPTIRNQSS